MLVVDSFLEIYYMLLFAERTCRFLCIFGRIVQKESLQRTLLLPLKAGASNLARVDKHCSHIAHTPK